MQKSGGFVLKAHAAKGQMITLHAQKAGIGAGDSHAIVSDTPVEVDLQK
jgi:hypothetical protein